MLRDFAKNLRTRCGAAAAWPARGALRLLRDQSGAAALEFAFVGPPLIALLLAILHTALIFLAQAGLQTAAEGAGRLIMTGQAQTYAGVGMTSTDFKNAVCGKLSGFANQLPPFLDCNRLYIDVNTASSFSTAVTTVPALSYTSGSQTPNNTSTNAGGTCSTPSSATDTTADSNGVYGGTNFCTGGAGASTLTSGAGSQVVVVRLIYLWPTINAPFFGLRLSNQSGSNRLLYAATVLVTENYT